MRSRSNEAGPFGIVACDTLVTVVREAGKKQRSAFDDGGQTSLLKEDAMNDTTRRWIPTLVFLMAALGASATSQAEDKKARAAIEVGAKALMAAVAKRDAAAIAATYAPDAQMLPANGDIVNGREAIQKLWQGWIDEGLGGLLLEPNEIHAFGDFGYDLSMYKLSDTSGKVFDNGKSLVVWKKHKGKWMLYRDIWTTSVPAPAQ